MKHLFLDLETMSQNVHDCAVIDCSVICIDTEKMLSENPYTLKDIEKVKRFKLSIRDQLENYNLKIHEDTVKFWSTTSEVVRKNIKPKSTDLNIKDFTEAFLQYLSKCGKIDYWWSRSNTFDPVVISRIFSSVDKYKRMNEHIPYWKIRDIRTFIDAKLDFPKENSFIPIEDHEFWNKVFQKHDSSWDVLADVLRMQAIIRAENDLEMIKR